MGRQSRLKQARRPQPFLVPFRGRAWQIFPIDPGEIDFSDPAGSLALPVVARVRPDGTHLPTLGLSCWGVPPEGEAVQWRQGITWRRLSAPIHPLGVRPDPPAWMVVPWCGADPAMPKKRCVGAAVACLLAEPERGLPFAIRILEAGTDPTPALIAADQLEEWGYPGVAEWCRGIARPVCKKWTGGNFLGFDWAFQYLRKLGS